MSGVYVIAECGINHGGSIEDAIDMITAAKMASADAVKFQTYVTDDICRQDNPEYWTLKKCELSYDQFRYLKDACDSIGIDFISTPDTVKDAEFLDTLGMRYMKIGSANNTEEFAIALRNNGGVQTPLLISLGMCSSGNFYDMPVAAWMHCVSSYPCPTEQANMGLMGGTLGGWIKGFSDHTIGSLCAIMAVARGAKFIEKHFTLDRTREGPDHHMSVEPDELASYIRDIRQAELALGDGVRRVMPCEQKTIEQLKARK